jgi:hypothetical protein
MVSPSLFLSFWYGDFFTIPQHLDMVSLTPYFSALKYGIFLTISQPLVDMVPLTPYFSAFRYSVFLTNPHQCMKVTDKLEDN